MCVCVMCVRVLACVWYTMYMWYVCGRVMFLFVYSVGRQQHTTFADNKLPGVMFVCVGMCVCVRACVCVVHDVCVACV